MNSGDLRSESNMQNLLLEQRENKITYHNVCQLVTKVVVLCLSPFYFGYCLTYLSTFSVPTIKEVYGDNAASLSFQGILIGILPVGAIFGAGSAPFLMKAFTRKQFILTINLLALIIEGVLQVPNVFVLLGCRAFQGYFIGNYMAIVPIYINELVPKQIVGSFGVFTQLFVVIAVVVSFSIGLILSAVDAEPFVFYRLMVTLNAFFILLQSFLLLINYVPESPNSLIAKNRNEQAKEVIGQFILPDFVEQTFKEKQMQVEVQTKKSGQQEDSQSKIKYSFRAFLLGFELPMMQQLTGINAIVTQSSNIVGNVIPSLADYTPIIINAVQLVATAACVLLLTRVGRKPLTLFGNLGLGVCDILIGILFLLPDWEPSGMLIFVLLIIYMIIYGISLGPVVWLYVPEIIPAKVVPLATMMNWLGCSFSVILTPIVIDQTKTTYPVFFFFGGITILFFVINSVLMVETKGRSVEQIAKDFSKSD